MPKAIAVELRTTITSYTFAAADGDPDPLAGSLGVSAVNETYVGGTPQGDRKANDWGASGSAQMTQAMGFLATRIAAHFAANGHALTQEQLALLMPAYVAGTREALYDIGKARGRVAADATDPE